MAVMDAGSRVNISIDISTNTKIQLPDCSKDISTRGSNYGSATQLQSAVHTYTARQH